MSDVQNNGTHARPMRLRDALRQARIEAADRTGVVVDLRDAEVARLEILNEALDPLFAQIPEQVDMFDRGISYEGDLIDLAALANVVEKSGAWYTYKGTRLGQEVFILTGKVQTNGASADTTYEVTADYASLATKSTAEANGMKVDSSMEVTEWDVKQDIVAPM